MGTRDAFFLVMLLLATAHMWNGSLRFTVRGEAQMPVDETLLQHPALLFEASLHRDVSSVHSSLIPALESHGHQALL